MCMPNHQPFNVLGDREREKGRESERKNEMDKEINLKRKGEKERDKTRWIKR